MKDLNDVDSVTAENTEKAEKKRARKSILCSDRFSRRCGFCGWTAWKFAKAITTGGKNSAFCQLVKGGD